MNTNFPKYACRGGTPACNKLHMFPTENHDKKSTNIFPNYFHFSTIPQFICSPFHLLPSPCFLSHPLPLTLCSLTHSNFFHFLFTPFILVWCKREENGASVKKWESRWQKMDQAEKGHGKQMGRREHSVRTEITKARNTTCVGDKTGHSIKQSQRKLSFLANIFNGKHDHTVCYIHIRSIPYIQSPLYSKG